ncbi:MAG: C2H2-type zinc finger protein [Candidatus Freyarchaeota archaeon]
MSDEVEVKVFRCPECAKIFDNEASLKAHRLRSHRVSPRTGKAPEPRGPTPSTTQVTLVSQSERFEETLRQAGLPELLISQIMVKAREIDLNDIYQVYNLLVEFRVSRDKIALIINLWSTKERIPIPPELRRELNIRLPPPEPPQYQYNYQPPYNIYGFPRPHPQPQPQIDFVELIKVIKNSGDDPEKQRLLEELRLRDQSERERNLLEKLTSQFQSLHEKTIENFNQLFSKLDERLSFLEEKLEKPTPDGYKEDSFRLLAQSVDKFTNILKEKDIGDKALRLVERLAFEPTPLGQPTPEQREKDEKLLRDTAKILGGTSPSLVKTAEEMGAEEFFVEE